MRWQREDGERSWEMGLPKGEIEGLKRFEKSHADSSPQIVVGVLPQLFVLGHQLDVQLPLGVHVLQ